MSVSGIWAVLTMGEVKEKRMMPFREWRYDAVFPVCSPRERG